MGDETRPVTGGAASSPAPEQPVRVTVALEQRGVWRAGLIVLVLVALAAFGWFVLDDGGSVFFTLLIAWFSSIAMEPAVGRLSRRMRRGAATGLVMLAVAVFVAVFALAFGRLIADQLVQAVKAVPVFAAAALDWVNEHFGTNYSQGDALQAVGITQDTLTTWAKELAGGVLGLVVSVLSGFFSIFTFPLFTFYFSADAPRLRRWIAQLFPPRHQEIVVGVWDLAVDQDRRLRLGPRRPRRHLRHDHGAVPAHHRHAVLAGPRHLDRGRGAVRADDRHLRRDPAPGHGRPDRARPAQGHRGADLRRGLPADREPHHRAPDQRQPPSTCTPRSRSPR